MSARARTRIVRVRRKARDGTKAAAAVFAATRVSHVAYVRDGHPYVWPTLHALVDGRLILHGSSAGSFAKAVRAGVELCVCATALDGLVLARSQFEHSVHYRSAVVFGRAEEVVGAAAKRAAGSALTDGLIPGRAAETRPANAKELRATLLATLTLGECSVKISDGPPNDETDDLDLPVWAGVVPLREVYGEPVPAPDLRAGIPLAPSVAELLAGR